MAKGTTFSADLLKFILNATPIANMADNAATSPLTQLWVSLHTADPTAGGNQTSSEVTYTGYQRVGIARSNSSPAWTITNQSASPNATISWPAGTGGAGTATFFAVGTSQSGTGKLLYEGPISPSIVCGNGVTPQLTSSSTVTES